MTVKPEVLETDFKTSTIGTLVAGRWFVKNADTSKISQGEYPMLLVTGGVLHKVSATLTGEKDPMLMSVATVPFICFAFDSQICFPEPCHQLLIRPAKRIQCASRTTSDRGADHPERGRRLPDKIRTGQDC